MLSRLVVHPSMRNQGLSRALDRARMDAAADREYKNLCVVSSDERRISTLRKAGFEVLRSGARADHGIPVSALFREVKVA
ncbi:MAG: GNAT family N-acetyltransferase [Maricaulis sp.]|nr:GNAT family N-acetyltransferase [Maricaulis sp.]MBO6848743.1 GNAT family N-acetyltransferase [Maricaulis sp.]MBO6878728.1 GNAT family N-acetyltransferase [Maricaulis sp.]